MASSVATMPTVDVGPFGSPSPFNLKKIITRDQQKQQQQPHHRRQDPPFPRWAAHDAAVTQPMSARAETREASPSPSESSSCSAASLIQMWREMEADGGGGGPAATPRAGENQRRQGPEKGGLVRVRCRREAEEMVERMQKEREREVGAMAQMRRVSTFSHRGRIQSMLKFRFIGKDLSIQYQEAPPSRKRAPERSQSKATIMFLSERFDKRSQNDSIHDTRRLSIVNDQFPVDSQDPCSSHSDDLFRTDNDQYPEVISIEGPENLPPESTSPESRSEDPDDGCQSAEIRALQSRIEEPNEASQCSAFDALDSIDKEPHERCQSPELNSLQFGIDYLQEECQSPAPNSLHFRSEDPNDGIHSLATSWDERNMWASNLDWPTMESQNVHVWQSKREVVSEELEPYRQQDIVSGGCTWMGDSYISWRSCAEDHDYYETFSDNAEIRELLERRTVTTSLKSDFCHKMNKMIIKLLQMQGAQYTDENFSEYGEQPAWRQQYEFHNADLAVSDSSLVPSSYQRAHYPDSWQHTSYTPPSYHSLQLQEVESVHDLKNEMVQMHQEISDLKKLVESCMKWHAKLHGSITEEVSSAIRQSVSAAKSSDDSKRTPGQKGSCCICHEMQVDSLLYRCGHMCACFKCAQALQWSSGKCPICQAPIVDVVRAYPPNTR